MVRSIIEKLSLNKFPRKLLLNSPSEEYFSELVFDETEFSGQPLDLIIAFVKDITEFQQIVASVSDRNALNENGLLYVAYPKKGNKRYPTYVHRDEIFPALKVNEETGYIAGTTLKFNRMVSLDEVFTIVGIKNARKKQGMKTKNQSAHDYAGMIPKVEEKIVQHSKAAAFFKKLTPGYQRGWAQYIYSAKQEATQEKRVQEMIAILELGFKSKELYRQSLAEGES